MILKQLHYDSCCTARAIIEGDKGIEYSTSICLEQNEENAWCSCPVSVFHQIPCKHINFLLKNIDRSVMVDKKKELSRIPTGSGIVDELLGGGFPAKMVTTIFGEPMSGKSIMAYQTGVNSIKQTGKETLLIDTEGVLEDDLRSILYKFGKRFEVDDETIDKKFRMIKTYNDKQFQSIQKLMMMFGYLPVLEMSEGGKYKIIFNRCDETLTDKELKNTSLIVIDSLTKPVKDSVGSEQANLPARAQVVERLFGKLYQIAELYNIAIVVLVHASINPAPKYGRDPGHAYGGNPIYYNSKYVIQLLNGTAEERKLPKIENEKELWGIEARRIMAIRKSTGQCIGNKIPIRLRKDYGFSDD